MTHSDPSPDFHSPGRYLNRELSWLEFNRRVLAQASQADLPVLERLFFLCIASANPDEFFEIRVAGLRQQLAFGAQQRGPDGLRAAQNNLLEALSA